MSEPARNLSPDTSLSSVVLSPDTGGREPRQMGALAEREREIVRLRYFEDLSQRQIVDRMGVSQMHVSRLLRASVDEMRQIAGVSSSDQ